MPYFGGCFFSCLLISLLIEFFQLFFSPRTVSLNDLIAECFGTLTGIFLWAFFGKKLLKAWQVIRFDASPRSRLNAMFVFYLIFSVLVKVTGTFAGLLIIDKHVYRFLELLRPVAGFLAAVMIPAYLLLCLKISGWRVSGWMDLQQGLRTFDCHMLIPFYYHYFSTETRAALSIAMNFGLYMPLGAAAWVLQGEGKGRYRMITAVFLALCLAFIIEFGKLFQSGRHPDFTNMMVAVVSVIFTWKIFDYFSPVFGQLSDE